MKLAAVTAAAAMTLAAAVPLATSFLAGQAGTAPGSVRAAFYCEYPKSVFVGQKSVTTPEVCIPSP